jgi:hypothetical protein
MPCLVPRRRFRILALRPDPDFKAMPGMDYFYKIYLLITFCALAMAFGPGAPDSDAYGP